MELLQLLTTDGILQYGGISLLIFVIFAETGLFFGIIFPGDYLVFTAGLVCKTDILPVSIYTLVISLIAAAILGSITGYFTGKYLGSKLFLKNDSWFFKKQHLEKTKLFYDKYGASTLIIGRFLPIIRTFSTILAGAVNMDFKQFAFFSTLGAVLWIGSLAPLGYLTGKLFPNVIDYLHYIIIAFLIATTIPVYKFFKNVKNLND